MAEQDPFYDLPYLNLPGFGETDADPGMPSAASAPSAEPTIPMPGADPVPIYQGQSPTPAIMMPGPSAPLPPNLQMPGAPAARRRAGTAVVLAGVGAGTGALLGGLWGAGSGLLFAGATMNAYRAKVLYGTGVEADRGEAVKSTIMAVLGLGLASYLGYRAHQAERGESRDDDDD